MSRLIYTPASLRDLSRLHDFLHAKDPAAARRAIAAIRESLRRLAAHPDSGRPAPGFPSGFRERFIRFGSGGYVALYRPEGSTTVVLAVRHIREAGY